MHCLARTKVTKLLVIAAILMLALPAVAAAKTTVALHAFANVERWRPILDVFHARHPDIEIVMQQFGGNQYTLQEALTIRIAAGSPPDLALTGLLVHAENRAAGFYADLSPYLQRDGVDLYEVFPAAAVDYFRSTGPVTGVPAQGSPHVLWYNMEMFDNAGLTYPNQDWRMTVEMVEAARRLTQDQSGNGEPDQWGFYYNNLWSNIPQFWGTSIFSPDGRQSNLRDPLVIESVKWAFDMYHTLRVTARTTGRINSGRLAMDWGNPSFLGSMPSAPFRWDIETLPITPTGGRITEGGLNGVAMVRGGPNPEAAWQFIKFIAEEDTQLLLMQHIGWGAAGPRVWARGLAEITPEAPNSFQNRMALAEAFALWQIDPVFIPEARRVYALRSEHLQHIHIGDKAPEVILEELHAVLQPTLDEVWRTFDARNADR